MMSPTAIASEAAVSAICAISGFSSSVIFANDEATWIFGFVVGME
jgi:hypothetical protein